jgi:pilus assembly protein Flp/PilA
MYYILKSLCLRFKYDEAGLTTVEYAIAGGLIAATLVVAFTDLGAAVGDAITGLTDILNGTGN